jgi:hypothetical protein
VQALTWFFDRRDLEKRGLLPEVNKNGFPCGYEGSTNNHQKYRLADVKKVISFNSGNNVKDLLHAYK